MITTLIYSVLYVGCKVWYNKLFALMKIQENNENKRRGDMILKITIKDLIFSNNELNKIIMYEGEHFKWPIILNMLS